MKQHMHECQCEHAAHFDKTLTPNGNPGHAYGVDFYQDQLVRVSPSYELCKDCASDCWQSAKNL